MADHFVVLHDFDERVNGRVNRYRAGMHYCARDGRKWDDLRSRLPEWERRGLIARGLTSAAHLIRGPVPIISGRASALPRSI